MYLVSACFCCTSTHSITLPKNLFRASHAYYSLMQKQKLTHVGLSVPNIGLSVPNKLKTLTPLNK